MKNNTLSRVAIVVNLLLGLLWQLGSTFEQDKYSIKQLITNAKWVKQQF